ncbi:MAG: hypothetical protein F2667_00355 [Actinobacteria bacterium]|uniref:Unannotated protein n=1 Tax=freshwater metagenome TaxID=449393 RepID=A0A6J6NEM6_9ZZZZ|nr:hypothetical protein [Actinomycetota bacterium]
MSMSGGVLTMELIEVPMTGRELSTAIARHGELVVSHRGTRLTRGLELGEEIVILDAGGEYHSAHVTDLEFDLEDTRYILSLGVRLPPEHAGERIDDSLGTPEAHGLYSTQSILDLLAELRDER